MSYAALGKIAPWGRYFVETDEVYFWRALFQGADIRSLQDMQAIAGAIGANQGNGLDLRGIAVEPAQGGFTVDAALTSKHAKGVAAAGSSAADVAIKVQTQLAERFPELQVAGAKFEENNDSDPKHHSLDFWLYHTIIWDIPAGSVAPIYEQGKPTNAFAKFEGLYRGKAVDGVNLKKWQEPQSPKPNGNGVPPAGSGPLDEDTTVYWIAGGAIAFWIFTRIVPRGAGAAR